MVEEVGEAAVSVSWVVKVDDDQGFWEAMVTVGMVMDQEV